MKNLHIKYKTYNKDRLTWKYAQYCICIFNAKRNDTKFSIHRVGKERSGLKKKTN